VGGGKRKADERWKDKQGVMEMAVFSKEEHVLDPLSQCKDISLFALVVPPSAKTLNQCVSTIWVMWCNRDPGIVFSILGLMVL
jgi:hypothetical protein